MSDSSKPEQSTARRNFLHKSIRIVPAAMAAACNPLQSKATRVQGSSAGSNTTLPEQVVAYVPHYFTTEEWAFINAACACLIPDDELGPGAIEAGVPAFIDRQMQGAFGHAARWYTQGPFVTAAPEFGYQGKATPREIYRAGIIAIDDYCMKNQGGKRFSECDGATQAQLLRGVESGVIAFDTVDGKTFFGWLLQNTKEGYLSDPIHGGNKNMGSWKMIGFPGARADFADWVRRHGEQYPLGPVSIGGQQSSDKPNGNANLGNAQMRPASQEL